MFRVGIDTGGTFTDFILYRDGEIHIQKIPSSPKNPADAVLKGLKIWGNVSGERQVIHGSTVATNTLLERKGAKTALITTKGFEDILEIGRQNRPQLYSLDIDKMTPLVQKGYRFGVHERTIGTGEILNQADPESFADIIQKIQHEGIESIAICLLFSYANPENERIVYEGFEKTGISISVSHRILPEYREYERCSTTVVNAYISPIMERYISHLKANVGVGDLCIMQSNGGFISAKKAKEEPVRTVLSGPAAGVVGAFEVAKAAGYYKIVTLDMGGTSTDVSLCYENLMITTESSIDAIPIKIPMINIHTVGAGGGSIAFMDEGGSLRVGPRSAGADPGPVCYGRGVELTVTDANLYLGRLLPDYFLGGDMALDSIRVEEMMAGFGAQLNLSPHRVAEGIIEVVNAAMERAIRVVSIERGYDTREFTLVSFGGGGGLHACEVAKNLSIPQVLIPKNPGLLSAFGMLICDVVKDYSQSVLIRDEGIHFEEIEEMFAPLIEKGMDEMSAEHIPLERVTIDTSLDMRYLGQSYEISVLFKEDYIDRFNKLHKKAYGYIDEKRPCEIVNLRVRMKGNLSKPKLKEERLKNEDCASASLGQRMIFYKGESIPFEIFIREKLCAGNRVEGPAIILEYSSTVLVPPNFSCNVDRFGNLFMKQRE
ncbi:MAG: hydantoinase/oxoprolinase family protein [Thermodesulfobacteriota bacterium]|nr:hydantoinase/oxoprolinase family protein [Thermodesulfobacteriota bacterium]